MENALPPSVQPLRIEIAQMRDLSSTDASDDRYDVCLLRIASRRLPHAVCLS
jgi:hypothetical protein